MPNGLLQMKDLELQNRIKNWLQSIVLAIHRRNGGELSSLPWNSPLLTPELKLDSLDLAEVMAAVEREWGIAPFELDQPPKTWADLFQLILRHQK